MCERVARAEEVGGRGGVTEESLFALLAAALLLLAALSIRILILTLGAGG